MKPTYEAQIRVIKRFRGKTFVCVRDINPKIMDEQDDKIVFPELVMAFDQAIECVDLDDMQSRGLLPLPQ